MSNCIDNGTTGKAGYQTASYKTVDGKWKTTSKHRVLYCIKNKINVEDIKGMVIRHTCDNPRCINPEHLVIGTHQDNMADMVARKRSTAKVGRKLTQADVDKIRELKPSMSYKELAEMYSIGKTTVIDIVKHRRW